MTEHGNEASPTFASLDEWLAQALEPVRGGRVLLIGPAGEERPVEPPEAWSGALTGIEVPDGLAALPAGERFDLGVVADALDALERRRAEQLLARLRDQLCREVLVLTGPESAWRRGELLALEYTPRARVVDARGEWRVHGFDLDSYNPQRAWNTPENWAHPENFHRYRW